MNTALTPINTSITSIQSDITSLDGRVTTLEQSGGGGTVPSNVVVSDDADKIVLLTQAEYDALVNNNQVEQDVLYYITDTTSDYVTNSSLNTTLADYAQTSDLSDYATTQYVDSEISQIDLSDYATTQYVDDAVANSGHVSSTTITTITQLTQSEYDDLVNNNQINSTTLYVIVEDGGSSSHTYEILEEIHATGYPTYIDTGVYTSSDISFEVLFKCDTDHTIENDRIIAGSTSWSDWQTMAFDYEGDPCLKCKFIGDSSWTTFSNITPDNNTHKLYLSSTEFKFDDTTLDTRSQSQYSTTNSQIRIAQSDMYQPAGEQGYYYYYYVKIWDDNTLIRNYVPAKRLSDDTYGFYDMENDTFNPSIGSSDFTGTSKSIPEYIDE